MLKWNRELKIEPKIKRKIYRYMKKNPEIDCFLIGFSCDMSQYAGFKILDGGLKQLTGSWKFYPVDWVCCKEEKLEELLAVRESKLGG